ncbi:MAG: hypothetical protein ABIO64_05635 [Burkholderiaceae bacterium]
MPTQKHKDQPSPQKQSSKSDDNKQQDTKGKQQDTKNSQERKSSDTTKRR